MKSGVATTVLFYLHVCCWRWNAQLSAVRYDYNTFLEDENENVQHTCCGDRTTVKGM